MGIGFVLMIWAVVGSIMAGIGLLVCGGLTAYFTRGVTKHRRTVVMAAGVFPFACLAWAGMVFILQAGVNEGLLKRDAGLGDTSHCPLPNGYQLLMIDVTDQATVYNPKTQSTSGIVADQNDAVPGVRRLQVAGRYLIGASDTKAFEHFAYETNSVDSYFILDTQVREKTQFKSYEELRAAAQQLGIQTQLQPIYDVYSHYRFTWFDVFAGLLFCLPLLIAAALMVRWIVRLRRTRLQS